MHEDGVARDVDERALARRHQAGDRSLWLFVELLGADPLAARDERQRRRPVLLGRARERRDEGRVERPDQDPDGAAACEADLERRVVGDPVLAQPGAAAVEHLLRLADDGRFDAAAGDRACDLAEVVQRQRRARVARCGAAALDDGRDRHAAAVGVPADEGGEDVAHRLKLAVPLRVRNLPDWEEPCLQPRKGVLVDKDRIEGNLKEAEGKVTGDEELEREGEAQGAWGKAKDSADDAWEKTKDAAGDAKDAVDKRT